MFTNAGCSAQNPPRSSIPPACPGAGGMRLARWLANEASPYGITAAMPSNAPRRITTTSRRSVGAAANASDARPNETAAPRPNNAERRVIFMINAFETRETQAAA